VSRGGGGAGRKGIKGGIDPIGGKCKKSKGKEMKGESKTKKRAREDKG